MKNLLRFVLAVAVAGMAENTQAQTWNVTGNAGTDPNVQFIGTTDSKALKIRTNNVVRMLIKSTGDVGIGTQTPTSKLHVNGVITATGGTSSDWNTAFSWGNHALAGYLTSESDPKVGANTTNFISRWNGSSLVKSNLFSNGSFLGLNAISPIGDAQFVITDSSTGGYGGMYVNVVSTSGGRPFYGYGLNGTSSCWTYLNQDNNEFRIYNSGDRMVVENDGDVRIGNGTTATDSRLDVSGSTTSTAAALNVSANYNGGNTDVIGVNSRSVIAPGFGYGVSSTGGYMGVRGTADATTYTGTAYGVYGFSNGTAGTRIGVYGTATGGTVNNWGGYFPTKVYATELRVGGIDGATGYALAVNGKAIAEEVRVELKASWPDYVFSDEYQLMPLDQLKKEIETNQHLPGIPSAAEMTAQGGIDLGDMQTRLVEKVEELTLYILQLKEQNDKLAKANELLQQRVSAIENK
jgi:hypothetical protein